MNQSFWVASAASGLLAVACANSAGGGGGTSVFDAGADQARAVVPADGSAVGAPDTAAAAADAKAPAGKAENTNALCADGIDNDGDGYTDCVDFSCSKNAAVTVCDSISPAGTEDNNAACTDGKDNDGDGYTDCGDKDCCAVLDCSAKPTSYCAVHEISAFTCADGKDNDGDGATDCAQASCCAVPACKGKTGDLGFDCGCSPQFPVLCAATAKAKSSCWTAGVDCQTVATCGDKLVACLPGKHVNCTKLGCEFDAPPPANVPAWLDGVWSRSGATSNNIYQSTDSASIQFIATGDYFYKSGGAKPAIGKFSVSGDTIAMASGPLQGKKFSISASFSVSCRIFNALDGSALWHQEEVVGCPTAQKIPAADCAYVGKYTQGSSAGGFGGSGGSTSSSSSKIELFRDGFYTEDFSSSSTSCFGDNCKSLSNSSKTLVGGWNSKSYGNSPLSNLLSGQWKFAKSSAPCP